MLLLRFLCEYSTSSCNHYNGDEEVELSILEWLAVGVSMVMRLKKDLINVR